MLVTHLIILALPKKKTSQEDKGTKTDKKAVAITGTMFYIIASFNDYSTRQLKRAKPFIRTTSIIFYLSQIKERFSKSFL